MIQCLSHATIYVKNQEEALEFYRDKLGFEVRLDVKMDGFRWLTVGPKGQPDLELVLMALTTSHMVDEEAVELLTKLVEKGAVGGGVFKTEDCKATFAELKAKGVEFISEPKEQPYGVEATFRDNSGNWFSLTQSR